MKKKNIGCFVTILIFLIVIVGGITLAVLDAPLNRAMLNPEGTIELNLSVKNMSKLPKEVAKLKNLKKLNISLNNFTELPKEIGELSQLEELDLSLNELNNISDLILNLTKLKRLDLSYNKFKEFPLMICKLESLEELFINGSEIKLIPENIGNLKKLQTLEIDLYRLLALPKRIIGLQNLRRLVIRSHSFENTIKELDKIKFLNVSELIIELDNSSVKHLEKLESIESLTISNTIDLELLFDSIKNLPKLIELDLTYNPMELPETIQNIKGLKTLYLMINEKTNISQIIDALSYCKNIENLILRNSNKEALSELPESIVKLNFLKLLNISYSMLAEDTKKVGNLRTLLPNTSIISSYYHYYNDY